MREIARGARRAGGRLVALCLAGLIAGLIALSAGEAARADPFVPSFWDPNRRLTKPDTSSIHLIRFLTADDYPPFNFTLPDGTLTGFNIELARAICDELQIACTVQARRWDTLPQALSDNRGDAVIAALAINAQTREKFAFTRPYMILPGRFAIRDGHPPGAAATPEKMAAAKVGVVAGGAHEAWLKIFFPKLTLVPFPTAEAERAALAKGEVAAIFGDGVALSLWLNGSDSHACCAFFGGPFVDRAYFGEGLAIAVRNKDPALRRALDYALARVAARGVYAEIYLKYFPIGAF